MWSCSSAGSFRTLTGQPCRRWASTVSFRREARPRRSSSTFIALCGRAPPRSSEAAMSKTLLLADDSGTIQRVIELTFAHEDVRVVSVGDGKRAVQWMETERPDIVLVDVEAPELDGYAVASHVK